MQQGRNEIVKVARPRDTRWHVHTSHGMQAFCTIGYDSQYLACEAVADALVAELHEVTGYRVQRPALLALTDAQAAELPPVLARALADVRAIEDTGVDADEDDVHGAIAARVARMAGKALSPHHGEDAPPMWELEFRTLRVQVQKGADAYTCPRCGDENVTPPHGYRLARCNACSTAFDTMG